MRVKLYEDITTGNIKTFAELKQEYETENNCEISVDDDTMIQIINENLWSVGGNIRVICNNDPVLEWCNDYAEYMESERFLNRDEIEESVLNCYLEIKNRDDYSLDAIKNYLELGDELLDRLNKLLDEGEKDMTELKINETILLKEIGNKSDYVVELTKVQKGNAILTGIIFKNKCVVDNETCPILYIRDYEELFKETRSYSVVADRIINNATTALLNGSMYNTKAITTWEYAKDNLMLCVGPKESNTEVVSFPYLNLELYVRVKVKNGTYKVTHKILNMWGISEIDLFEEAVKLSSMTFKINSLSEMLSGKIDDDFPMLVVTTMENAYGASAIYYKGILRNIANKLDDNLVIIPSSIHEILIIPETLSEEMEDICDIIKEVNSTEVLPEEVLSDNYYLYNRITNEITYNEV